MRNDDQAATNMVRTYFILRANQNCSRGGLDVLLKRRRRVTLEVMACIVSTTRMGTEATIWMGAGAVTRVNTPVSNVWAWLRWLQEPP